MIGSRGGGVFYGLKKRHDLVKQEQSFVVVVLSSE